MESIIKKSQDWRMEDMTSNTSREIIAKAIRQILEAVGEDLNREGLVDTPSRVAKAYEELLVGYTQDIYEIANGAFFGVPDGNGDMVIVENIPYSSMCEHHMLPFTGKAHVAYLPSKKIIGLSKIPRLVEMFARRLQVQERLTNQIADSINELLNPKGVMVIVDGSHMCASLRGIKKHGVNMRTRSLSGEFKDNKDLRDEFFQLIKN